MKLKIDNKIVDISKCKGYRAADFNPDQIFDCGQCFRWEKNAEGIWETPERLGLTAGGDSTYDLNGEEPHVSGDIDTYSDIDIAGTELHNKTCSTYDANDTLRKYFDLDRDYGAIKEYLAEGDPIMAKAIEVGSGIRILNQPKWETLISFIISQNNNIPRIKGCINSLARTLGKDGQLPKPEVLADASTDDIACCKLGYRDKYLIETARQVLRMPKLLDQLAESDVSASEAVEVLQKLSGVGPKVANCIALFGLGKVDCFPLDVWMKRVMNQLYGIPEGDVKAMKKFAEEHFAPYGGIAQQYLFYFITHKGVDNDPK